MVSYWFTFIFWTISISAVFSELSQTQSSAYFVLSSCIGIFFFLPSCCNSLTFICLRCRVAMFTGSDAQTWLVDWLTCMLLVCVSSSTTSQQQRPQNLFKIEVFHPGFKSKPSAQAAGPGPCRTAFRSGPGPWPTSALHRVSLSFSWLWKLQGKPGGLGYFPLQVWTELFKTWTKKDPFFFVKLWFYVNDMLFVLVGCWVF